MFKTTKAFSSFSVDNLQKAKKFYSEKLGVKVTEEKKMGLLFLHFSGSKVMVYPRDNHTPAAYTVLNFPVSDVEKTVDGLVKKGIKMEQYKGFEQDKKGISRSMGIAIAWFTDPSGNIIAVLEEK